MEKIPRKKEYLLRLSDGSTIRVLEEHLSRFALEEGSSLSEHTIRQLEDLYEYATVRGVALRLLKVRPRTETELRRRFRKDRVRGEIVGRVLDDLKREGCIDDRVFARLWIKEKIGRADSGRRLIMAGLQDKGVDRNVAEEELAESLDDAKEVEIARHLAVKRLRRMRALPLPVRRRRLYNLLVRRGFGSDTASAALEYALESIDVEDAT